MHALRPAFILGVFTHKSGFVRTMGCDPTRTNPAMLFIASAKNHTHKSSPIVADSTHILCSTDTNDCSLLSLIVDDSFPLRCRQVVVKLSSMPTPHGSNAVTLADVPATADAGSRPPVDNDQTCAFPAA